MNMDNLKHITEVVRESIAVKQSMLDDISVLEKLNKAAEIVIDSLKKGGKVFFCGNGGSAADAQHLAAELSGRFY